MSVSITAPTHVSAGEPFDVSVDVSGAPAGAPVKATLRADDDPSLPPTSRSATASGSGQARLLFRGLVLERRGSRALVATAEDDIGVPLGRKNAFVEVR